MSTLEERLKRCEAKLAKPSQPDARAGIVCLDADTGEYLISGRGSEDIAVSVNDWSKLVQPGARIVAGDGLRPL